MELNTPYPPLIRAPLKMRGVFGVAWQLYKRGFWPMFGFTLLLVGVFALILMLALGNLVVNTGLLDQIGNDLNLPGLAGHMPVNDYAVATSSLIFVGVMWLLSLVYAFLGMPAYLGATFMEMDQRMEGRLGTLYQLFRYALPIGLKRFYTTFLSMFVVQMIASVVISFVLDFLLPLVMFSSIAVGMKSAGGPNLTIAIGITILFSMLLSIANLALISLIYPVAAHEGKRAFDAVGRALKLSLKRFGRLIAALLLYMLLLLAAMLILMLPLLLLWQNTTAAVIAVSISLCLWAALVAPFYPAFCTALYVDSAARVPDVTPDAPIQPQVL